MIGADAGSTQLVPVLWEQTRPNTKHTTGEHTATSTSECERSPKAAAAAPGRQHQQPRLCRAALAHGSFTASSRAARAPRPSHPPCRRGSHLKLAGDFNWMLRPDGVLAFRFSLSAMPPCYISSIGSAARPPSRHLRSADAAIGCCLHRPWDK